MNVPYIDKRIATLELLTQRHKLRSQFPYLLRKLDVVREFGFKTFSIFATKVSSNKRNFAGMRKLASNTPLISSGNLQQFHLRKQPFVLLRQLYNKAKEGK